MSKKNDDSIERFFRKAVAQQDLSHRDSDWKRMEKMLDDHAVTASSARARRTNKIVAYSVVSILLISAIFFTLIRPWETSSEPQLTTKTTQNVKPSQAAAGMLGPLSGTKENPSADLLSSEKKIDASSGKTVRDGKPVRTEVSVEDNRQEQTVTTNIEDQTGLPETDSNESGALRNASIVSAPVITPASVVTHPVTVDTQAQKGDAVLSSAPTEEVVVADSIVTNDKGVQNNARAEEENDNDNTPSTKIPSRWSVALTAAPDFSSTSLGRYSDPGTAYGLFVGYRPMPRWQVSTGLIKTAKQYEGYGDEYQPPAGYWENRTNGIIPDEVEGSCGIIEWPLIVRFDFVTKAKSKFYVSSGVSSYLMRHESYKYRFAQENPGAASSWHSQGPTSYAFSIGHLSAGYERSFSNRVAVAIEPYFKVPFKTIGWTHINLHTTGAYLTVRYTFQKQSVVPTTKK